MSSKKYPIIQVSDYLYAVDKEAKIQKNDWFTNDYDSKVVHKCIEDHIQGKIADELWTYNSSYCCKIIASNNSSLKDVLQLPPIEDIKRLADDSWEGCHGCDENDKNFWTNGFYFGYKAAQSKGTYSEEDIKTAMFKYASWLTGGPQYLTKAKDANEAQNNIIKSLSKVPKYIEVEMTEWETPVDKDADVLKYEKVWLPKYNYNKVIQGRYIYE